MQCCLKIVIWLTSEHLVLILDILCSMKFSEYIESLEKSDPGFKEGFKEFSKITPTKRKVRLFLDRNIPEGLKEGLKTYAPLKVIGIAGENDPDEFIWGTAKRKRAIIISLDKGDFWNDTKFPLRESPGVILLASREQSIDVQITALSRFLGIVIAGIRIHPDFLKKSKYRISTSGYVQKLITYTGSVEVANIEYD